MGYWKYRTPKEEEEQIKIDAKGSEFSRLKDHEIIAEKKWNARKIMINGIVYNSLQQAANGIGASATFVYDKSRELDKSSLSELTFETRVKRTFVFKKIKENI